MSRLPHPAPPSLSHPSLLLLPALVGVLLLFPPETRGECQAGAAALLALAGLLLAPRALTTLGLTTTLGLLLFVPLTVVAEARGAVPEAWATLLLAVSAGTCATAIPAGRDRALVLTLASIGVVVGAWGVVQSVYGLAELAERVEAGLRVADESKVLARARSGRAFAGFETPAGLGGCLALTLPVTLGAALDRAGIVRRLLVVAASVQACGLVATRSATAVGGLVLALALCALCDRRSRKLAGVALALAAALLAIVVVARAAEVTDPSGPDSAWRLRAGNARIALEVIADHPWTGVGPGGYGEAYPRYRRPGDNESQHAHDVPLELCAEWGVLLGLLGTIALFGAFLGPVLRRSAEDAGTRRDDWWRRGAAIGLAALALQNLADFTLLLPSLLWTAAIVRGRLAARVEDGGDAAGGLTLLRLGAATATVLAACVAALSGLAWNERFEARQSIASGEIESATERAGRATRLAPWDPDGWLLLGQAALSSHPPDRELAGRAAERAVGLAPTRPAARALRSRVRLLEDDLPGALADATEAARLYPMSPLYAKAKADIEGRFRPEGGAP